MRERAESGARARPWALGASRARAPIRRGRRFGHRDRDNCVLFDGGRCIVCRAQVLVSSPSLSRAPRHTVQLSIAPYSSLDHSLTDVVLSRLLSPLIPASYPITGSPSRMAAPRATRSALLAAAARRPPPARRAARLPRPLHPGRAGLEPRVRGPARRARHGAAAVHQEREHAAGGGRAEGDDLRHRERPGELYCTVLISLASAVPTRGAPRFRWTATYIYMQSLAG